MQPKGFCIAEEEKKRITDRLKACLETLPNIAFAYLHGSFVTSDRFRDVDIAVYYRATPVFPLNTELELETTLGRETGKYPVDVRVLNGAPVSFRYNVIKCGQPMVVNDEDARADFVEATLSSYFDFAPFRRMYLREALGLGL